jgi:hypothetical protein
LRLAIVVLRARSDLAGARVVAVNASCYQPPVIPSEGPQARNRGIAIVPKEGSATLSGICLLLGKS